MIAGKEELGACLLGLADGVAVDGLANASTLTAGLDAEGERSEALILLVSVELVSRLGKCVESLRGEARGR